jgi:glycosyltransferase involved in cell wall biosynthesis
MASVAFLIPGDLQTRTGGYEYDRHIVQGLISRGHVVSVHSLDGSFPFPPVEALAHADRTLFAIDDGQTVVIDGLAFGAMAEPAARHARRLRIAALVHHPLALETGLAKEKAAALRQSEHRALQSAWRVIVTSRRTAETLRNYDVTPDRVAVVEPGTEPAPIARGSSDGVVRFVCVASLVPRKGHEVLFRALARIRHHRWALACAGSADRDPGTAARLQRLLSESGIEDRVQLVGEADTATTSALYDASDVFVLPTLYEGYGMVVAEAVARGLPVISTPTGAIEDLVGSDAGILVAPGHLDGWVDALSRLCEPEVRHRLAAGARRRRQWLPTWEDASARMAEALALHG